MSQKDNIMPLLLQRKKELEKAIKRASFILQYPVEERLEISGRNGHYRYYQTKKDDIYPKTCEKKYLSDIHAAKRIAEYDYAVHMTKLATAELSKLDKLLALYQDTTPEDYYSKLHPGRKSLISPLLPDDEAYTAQWLSEIPKSQNTYQKFTPFQTENNETVRSKSEKIIADKLKIMGVPYIYEKPLYLRTGTKFPDFTAINQRTRKEYYWEHLGKMDDSDYFESAMTKLEVYYENDIWPGKNLIITYETENHPIDISLVEKIIREYLL